MSINQSMPLIYYRWYIHKRWSVLKKLNIPHDSPSILGLGNLTRFLRNVDEVSR